MKQKKSRKQFNYPKAAENSIYGQNMRALRKNYPHLADKVDKAYDYLNYELVPGSNGIPNLRVKQGNFLYYAAADPMADVSRQIAALGLRNAQLAVFLGIGLGYELIHYVQAWSEQQKTKSILVIEKDPAIFKMALKTCNLAGLIANPEVVFLVGEAEENLYTRIRSYLGEKNRFYYVKAMKPVYHMSSLRLYKDYYMKALRALRDSAADQVLEYGNDPRDSLIGIENMLENLDEIIYQPGINLLYDKFKNRPAVVVSSGPSLDKNKHLLKGLEDRALIICADSTLKVLLRMGVKPHLVTVLERVPEIVPLVKGLEAEEVKEVYLAACPVVVRGVYQAYPGPRVVVYREFSHFKWLGIDKGMLPIKLSAGNMSFKVAEALGCDPIILIGQDLAFSRDGATHVSGTEYGNRQQAYFRSPPIEVMGNDGQPILTSDIWYKFLKGYEMDVASYRGRCINATEGGAYIAGTEVMPFQEAIDKYIKEPFDPLAVIQRELARFSNEEAESDLKRVIALSRDTINDIQEIIAICRKGVETIASHKELEQCLIGQEVPEDLRVKLPAISEEIMEGKMEFIKHYNLVQFLLAQVIQSFEVKFEIEMNAIPEKYDDPDLVLIEVLLRHSEWYAVIGDLTAVCLDSLQRALDKLTQEKEGLSALA